MGNGMIISHAPDVHSRSLRSYCYYYHNYSIFHFFILYSFNHFFFLLSYCSYQLAFEVDWLKEPSSSPSYLFMAAGILCDVERSNQ